MAGLEAENELGPRQSEQDRSLQAPSSAELMSSSSLSIGQSTEQQDWGHAQPRSLQGTPEIYVSQATYVEPGDATEFDPNHSSWEQSPVNVMSGRKGILVSKPTCRRTGNMTTQQPVLMLRMNWGLGNPVRTDLTQTTSMNQVRLTD